MCWPVDITGTSGSFTPFARPRFLPESACIALLHANLHFYLCACFLVCVDFALTPKACVNGCE